MSLENIIKAGKEDKKIKSVVKTFEENPYLNLYDILKNSGEDVKWIEEAGLDVSRDFLMKQSPAQTSELLKNLNGMAQSRVAKNVIDNYQEAIGALSGEEGRGYITHALGGIKPEKFSGANDLVYKAHTDFYKAIEDRKDPDKKFKELIKGKEETLAGQVLIYLSNVTPNFTEAVMHNRVNRAAGKLQNSMGVDGEAQRYITGLYESADDNGKMDIAYHIGLGVTGLEAEKKKKEKSAEPQREAA